MKKVILVVSALFIGAALADSTPTSVGYVDNAIGALQNKISAVDTNTVLTHTNTAGEIGQKSIYDATGNYATQTDALVTAEVANAAIQNAIDGEFVCTEWLDGAEHTNENCLIYTVHNQSPNRILPTGYTPLEYIESTGTQWIDTGVIPTLNTGVSMRAALTTYNYTGYANDNVIFGASNKYVFKDGSAFSIDIFKTQVAFPHGGVDNLGYNANSIDISNVLYQIYDLKINYLNDGLARVDDLSRELSYSNTMTTRTLFLFGCNNGTNNTFFYTKGMRLFDTVLTEETIISHHFIPARRDSDGKLGMYDLVSRTFFTNAGTGEFIAGPELNIYLPSGN